MDFKNRVILQLNSEKDLISSASYYFKEPPAYINEVVDLIVEATILAINTQLAHNKRNAEFLRIGKECSFLKFTMVFGSDLNIIEMGRGINSEIFGVSLVHIVEDISRKTSVRSSTVHALMAFVTPVVLSTLHTIHQEKKGELLVAAL